MDIFEGQKLKMQCYKHDGSPHKSWDEAVFIDKIDNYIVFGNNKTLVTESKGNTWKTNEPAIMYFFEDKWFNIIAQLKQDGIYYYCNIASPYIIEDETIKYIDYDLDLRIFETGQFKILDSKQYQNRKKEMGYGKELDQILTQSLNELIQMYKEGDKIFTDEYNKWMYERYRNLKTTRY